MSKSTDNLRKVMPVDYRASDFSKLLLKTNEHELLKRKSTAGLDVQNLRSPDYRMKCVMRASLDDIAFGINMCKINMRESVTLASDFGAMSSVSQQTKGSNPFIKIMLKKTGVIILYEQSSFTALVDTDEGRQVQADNERYDNILSGLDKTRRCVDSETQTLSALKKSRMVNTERVGQVHLGCYVSNFEMFDTYQNLEKSTKSIDVDGKQKLQVTTYKVGGVDQFVDINRSPNFQLALMLTKRILASNVFEKEQRRFRNMTMPDPLAEDVKFKYRLCLLWRLSFSYPLVEPTERVKAMSGRSVTDIRFCPNNGDVLAVAYGAFSNANKTTTSGNYGAVYIWNIKNPVNPERCYHYKVPVTTVEFSPTLPQLIAIGLSDGSIQVCDITNPELPPVATSRRKNSPSYEPITNIKWIKQTDYDRSGRNIAAFLALSQNGSIIKYQMINSPYLFGQQQQKLQRVDDALEGIQIERTNVTLQANRHPQGLALILDPTHSDIYYVLTDEGTQYTCSTNYPQQHLALRQVHEAPAVFMDFSPWSPKLYLTCGSDWCIRIWIMGILQPLVTLQHHLLPIYCAQWSRTHSTILVSLSRSTIDIWDLRNSTLRPVSSTPIEAGIYFTTFNFSHCGRSIAVGNEAGHVLMLSFEDMPFPPHFQYKQLKHAIYKALATKPNSKQQLKSIGYFGYPNYGKNNFEK